MQDEIVDEISVCIDCMLVHANGETGERDAGEPEPWSRILADVGFSVTMGGVHSDDCDWSDCDCDDLGFSWCACEGCGSNLGGDRFRFTVWRWSVDHARIQFRSAIKLAREAITDRERIEWLGTAGSVRRYLADRFAEDRRIAAVK